MGRDPARAGQRGLLDRVPPRYRALVLLATFASLRFGELAGLRRGQVDLEGCSVRIISSTAETDDGRLIDDDPKSQAGRRRVAYAKEIAPELRWHLERVAQPGSNGLVFIGPKGGRLRRSTFRRTWTKVRDAVGLPDLHLHDLRHTGNTMAAGQGASLRELMERMGHSSSRAALIYQHATRERDEAIAAGMGKLLRQARRKVKTAGGGAGTDQPSGTQRARARKRAF
jgi:integrase